MGSESAHCAVFCLLDLAVSLWPYFVLNLSLLLLRPNIEAVRDIAVIAVIAVAVIAVIAAIVADIDLDPDLTLTSMLTQTAATATEATEATPHTVPQPPLLRLDITTAEILRTGLLASPKVAPNPPNLQKLLEPHSKLSKPKAKRNVATDVWD